MLMKTRKTFSSVALAAVAALAALPAVSNAAPTLPSAVTQLGAVTTSISGYSTVMFAIAIAAVGILIGVKWIKRARGAA